MRCVLAVICLAALFVLSHVDPGQAQQPAGDKSVPNIVLIVADDLGFSDLGCYGSEITTTNLNRMAMGGLRFTQMYSAGRCCPTRAALLTGLYPHQTGVGDMMEDYRFPGYRANLNRECATLAELLRAAGYQTMMVGKWHLTRFSGPEGPKFNWPTNRGFDKFYGTIHGEGSYFDPATLCRGETFFPDRSKDYYYTDAISRSAADFIDEAARSNKPFFLYAAYTAPHWPLQAPADSITRYRGKYAAGWDELRKTRYDRMVSLGLVKPQWKLSPRETTVRDWDKSTFKPWQQRRMEVYAAQIDEMDRGIGKILDKLRQRGVEKNTLIVFLSDNGAAAEELTPKTSGPGVPSKAPGDRIVRVGNDTSVMPGGDDTFQSYGIAWANASNTPFRSYKSWTYEGGIATPMIVYWPGRIKPGGEFVHEVAHVIDIVPTFLELAKYRYPKTLGGYPLVPLEGKSLVPLLEGGKRPQPVLFWEHEGNRAVRDGKWKLVARYNQPWELYDMEADRTELKNLADRFAPMVKEMGAQYDAWAKRVKVEPWNGPK